MISSKQENVFIPFLVQSTRPSPLPAIFPPRGLLSANELEKLNFAIDMSPELKRHTVGRTDDQGRKSELCIWNHPGDDILGTVSRTRKVARTAQRVSRPKLS